MTKPKKPTEEDMMSVLTQAFISQRNRDLGVTPSNPVPPAPAPVSPRPAPDPNFNPMTKISPVIPQDLKYRLSAFLVTLSRKTRSRVTQDQYVAKAISNQLDEDESGHDPWEAADQLSEFLRNAMREGALAEGWVSQAKALLDSISDGGR